MNRATCYTNHTHENLKSRERGWKMEKLPKFFGKVPVGTKGQIVIPVEARRAMDIKPGDSLVVISGPPHDKRMISLVSEDDFNKLLKF